VIVHIGLGNFHRAHQCWWTGAVDPEGHWPISAYTGRSPDTARRLTAQGCRYTLVERGPDGDRFELVTALARARDGADLAVFADELADPATAVVTLTVTESGYHLNPAGELDLHDPAVAGDRCVLAGSPGPVVTPVGRLVHGLRARYRRGGAGLAVVPCDNLPHNGRTLRAAVLALATEPDFRDWLRSSVSFVDTSVDRITPRTTADDLAAVEAATGFADQVPVVTEPFHDWVLCGQFPGGRPTWERAGARFVADIEPWQRRKLWLLNAAHSTLCYAGRPRGHRSVAEAWADPVCAELVRAWWGEVGPLLPAVVELGPYTDALATRFANPRIAHELDQIALDGVHKLRVRVAAPARQLRASGEPAVVAARILAAWMSTLEGSTFSRLSEVDAVLAQDRAFVATVERYRTELSDRSVR
jgi:fructuronate reductase